MSSSDVARSQRALDKIGARLGLTDPGKNWLTAAVDPFHDLPLRVDGYPDVNEAASVVQVIKMSAQVSVPSGVAAGANWDCHIHSFPWENDCSTIGGNYSQSNNSLPSGGNGAFLVGSSNVTPTTGAGGVGHYGGISICSVTAGAPTFDYVGTGAGFNIQVPFVTELSQYMNGEFRIIAKGFEVINTTSELNIQGLVTCYRQPCEPIDAAKATTVVDATGNTGSTPTYRAGTVDLVQTSFPPISTTEALLLDGSKQWKAKEGCYVVPTLSASELPSGLNQTGAVLKLSVADPARGTPPTSGIGWGLLLPHGSIAVPANFQFTFTEGSTTATYQPISVGAAWFFNYNHAGAYFTGLSNTTTLQVNAIYYIERFPTQQDADLVVLATQSARHDCVAMDLYSEIIKEMPVGVPQRMNGLGEWFGDAISAAADFVSPVLSAIPHPMTQGMAMAAKTAGGVAKAIMGKKEAPGQTYSAQGANVSASKPKKKATVTVVMKKKKVPTKK